MSSYSDKLIIQFTVRVGIQAEHDFISISLIPYM